jgi:hypothetical protein
MFLSNSRYAKTAQIQMTLPDGTQISAVKLRAVPATPGHSTPITANDRLDIMAQRLYDDPTRHWHIGDANTALNVRELFVQWLEDDLAAQPITIFVPEN